MHQTRKLNHRASTNVKASNPNTWSSHRPFMRYEPLAPPIRVTLNTHTQLQPNMFSVPFYVPCHVLGLWGLHTLQTISLVCPKVIQPATIIIYNSTALTQAVTLTSHNTQYIIHHTLVRAHAHIYNHIEYIHDIT